eukprot:4091394-Amphidinium_carterae.1
MMMMMKKKKKTMMMMMMMMMIVNVRHQVFRRLSARNCLDGNNSIELSLMYERTDFEDIVLSCVVNRILPKRAVTKLQSKQE